MLTDDDQAIIRRIVREELEGPLGAILAAFKSGRQSSLELAIKVVELHQKIQGATATLNNLTKVFLRDIDEGEKWKHGGDDLDE